MYARPTYPITCPKCGARPYEHCRALTSGRVTDTHTARIEAANNCHTNSRGIRGSGVWEMDVVRLAFKWAVVHVRAGRPDLAREDLRWLHSRLEDQR
jgi:hypothetical protein